MSSSRKEIEVKHTEGPWYRDGYKNDVVRSAIVRDARGFEVALTRHWGVKETEANANLIAAAPEMLAALKMVLQHGRIDDSEGRMAQVASVITKAEGY